MIDTICDVTIAGFEIKDVQCYDVSGALVISSEGLEKAFMEIIKNRFFVDATVIFEMRQLVVICDVTKSTLTNIHDFIGENIRKGLLCVEIEGNYSYMCVEFFDVISKEQAIECMESEQPGPPE